MSDVVIRVEAVSKTYRLGQIGATTLREDFSRLWARWHGRADPTRPVGVLDGAGGGPAANIWALKDVAFEVRQGEALAIIGSNGAGKSTLLKILSRITAPTAGCVFVKGRIASLLEVGTGFHGELTGRENIFLNGAVLGMSRAEIARTLDEIIAFSGCQRFIDTPVKRYSSGMVVRLGFAVAAHLDAEILVVDEVLAVGDIAFQLRCYDRMEEIRRDGATVLVVSHNMNAIRRLCQRTMVIHDGKHVFTGETDEAVSLYNDILGNLNLAGTGEQSSHVEILDFSIIGARGKVSSHVETGDELTFRMDVRFREASDDPAFGFRIHKDTGQEVYSENTMLRQYGPVKAGESMRVEFRIRAALPTSSYIAKAMAFNHKSEGNLRAVSESISFFVSGRPFVKGTADLAAVFDVERLEGDPTTGNGQAQVPQPFSGD